MKLGAGQGKDYRLKVNQKLAHLLLICMINIKANLNSQGLKNLLNLPITDTQVTVSLRVKFQVDS